MSNIYDVKIYSKTWGTGNEGTLMAVLDEVSNIKIERQISNLSRTTFDIPRGNIKLSDISIGRQIKIFRKDNGNLEYEGVVSGPLDKDKNPVAVTTFNKGLHLEGYKVPWSFEFENLQFDEILNNELLREYRFVRANTLDDFDDGTFTNTATINVASGVTPSDEDIWLMLATSQASPIRFVSHGTYISDAFDLKTDAIDQVTSIDLNRIRYQAIIGQTGDISIRVRYAPDSSGSPGSWGTWSAGQSQILEDEMKHLGITTFPAMATLDQWLQVAFEFSSNTSYSNSTFYSPAIQAFEVVGQYPTQDFAMGSVESTTEGERVTASFDSHLQILDHVVEIWGVQWEITNSGTINTLTTIGNNLSNIIRLEEEKNCNVINYSEEDEELLNVVWGLGHGEGLNRLYTKQTNYTNARTYGKRISVWETANRSKTTLQNEAISYRILHQDPDYRITLDVIKPPGYFKAGDIIHFVSSPMDMDSNYQIMREIRFEDNTGERIQIDLDEVRVKYTDEYIHDQEEVKAGVDNSIKNYTSGVFWTGWIDANDTTWKEINMNVGWEGEFGKASVTQVHEETTDSYTVAGTSAIAEIARYTTEGMVIRYRRLNIGANRIRLEISWELWSTKMRRWRMAS